MRRKRPGIGAELLPIALILISLAGSLGLVIAMHRRVQVTKVQPKAAPKAEALVALPKPEKAPEPPAVAVVVEEEPPVSPAPVIDPTVKALEQIASEASEQERARREADSRSSTLLAAIQKAEAESSRWRTRETLAKTQLSELDGRARALEQETDALAMDRDLLASQRDAAKALVQKAKTTAGGYSVLPNKNPNGTWQRPVIIECGNGEAILQPKGQHFNLLDLSPLLGPRGSPLIGAVAKELIKIQGSASPDGAPIIPYIYFIVRPNGIRPFYDARSRLEPLGIAFGYELVEQDWEIEYPDFDALTAWDGSGVPFSTVKAKSPRTQGDEGGLAGLNGSPSRRGSAATLPDEGGSAFLWPADRPSPKATTDQVSDSPYVWPSQGGGSSGKDSGSFLGSENARTWLDEPKSPGHGPGSGFSAGDLTPPSGNQAGMKRGMGVGTGRQAQARPSASGFGPNGANGGEDADPSLVPVSPDGLPDFSRPENLIPDSRRSGGLGSAKPTTSPSPPRPASGRVRIDPNLLAEAAAAEDEEEARKAMLPFGEAMPELNDTNPGSPPDSPLAATQPPPVRLAPDGPTPTDSSQSPKGQSPQTPPGGITQQLFGSTTGSKPATAGTPSSSRNPSPASSSSSTASSGIESSNGGSSGADGKDVAEDLIFNPRKPLVNKTVRVPLDLVVACGPNGVVIHPGGYRISRATLRKEGLLKTDLQTIVRNHELIDAHVKPIPRLQFLVETGGAETYAEARRQTVLSGLGWPVSIKVSESAGNTIFPKEQF